MFKDSYFKRFYAFLFLTTGLTYLSELLPFMPRQILGFNMTGYAWIIMLLITLIYLARLKQMTFPVWFWIPWVAYLIIYLILDFSSLGLQLTLQYMLPLLVGIVASSFEYSEEKLRWLYKWLTVICGIAVAGFIIGRFKYGANYIGNATTPMLLCILASLVAGLWFISKGKKYLIIFIILFLVPAISVTRMGIAAMATVFILHFANKSVRGKIIYGTLGLLGFLIVFNSSAFQEKTFYGGKGSLEDLTFNYYDNPDIRSSGRISWKNALEPGLKARPIWGNGPRADNAYLTKITRMRGGEAHNDYLSVRFNYGYVGLAILLFGFISSFLSLFRISRRYNEIWYLWLTSSSTLTLFFALLMFMYTDNILKYTIYFPNYFFALMGIAYSLKRDEDIIGGIVYSR